MAFPPVYPYPAFFTSAGDRLHPGDTLFGGGRAHRWAALRAGVLWRVGTPIGYPSVLYLFSMTARGFFVRLDQALAGQLVPIPVSERYGPANNRAWYDTFAQVGLELFAVDYRDEGFTFLTGHSYRLPPERNRVTLTVGLRVWGFSEKERRHDFHQLYTDLRRAEAEDYAQRNLAPYSAPSNERVRGQINLTQATRERMRKGWPGVAVTDTWLDEGKLLSDDVLDAMLYAGLRGFDASNKQFLFSSDI